MTMIRLKCAFVEEFDEQRAQHRAKAHNTQKRRLVSGPDGLEAFVPIFAFFCLIMMD